ncbi:MAG: acyltransferase family protein, partial [Candidatus Omnitrophica bacterium]|nr:acyltransferase family protein [Candidatus Omnitrophota bacterium]
FFGKSLNKGTPLLPLYTKYTKRLLLVFITWTIFYAVFPHSLIDNILRYGLVKGAKEAFYSGPLALLTHHPVSLLLEGSGVHLWFLPSLIISLSIISGLILAKKERLLLPLAAALYLFGVLAGSYAKTPLGININFNTRDGPFFGTLFTVLGLRFSRLESFSFKTALAILLAGCLLQLSEAYLLQHYFNINSFYDYALGTAVLGTGVFFFALAHPQLGKSAFISQLSQLSLGIYLFHPFVYHIVLPFRHLFNPVFWDISLSFAVFAISAFAVWFLKSVPFTKQFVT